MKKLVFLFCLVFVFWGCTERVILHQPIPQSQMPAVDAPTPKVAEQTEPLFIPGGVETWYGDPTLGRIENDTPRFFLNLWIDPEVKEGVLLEEGMPSEISGERLIGRPSLRLWPGLSREVRMSLGSHVVYAEASIKVYEGYGDRGWYSVGFAKKSVIVSTRVKYEGHYGWKVSFRESDFKR